LAGKSSRSARWSASSLHGRVIAAASLALAFSLAGGAAALLWDARRSVNVELAAARASAVQSVRSTLAGEAPGAANLQRLVRTFDGNRHIRASLRDAAGRVVAVSSPYAPRVGPPGWFVSLVDPRLQPQRILAPDGASIGLEPDPVNEIGEAWAGLRDALFIAALLAGLAFVLIRRAVARALRPLDAFSQALARVGAGDFEARVAAGGVAELEPLAEGFNAMAGQLDAIDRENRRLHEQLLTVQEEERAELARDLHDEIGPYLFAVNIDAAAVRDLALKRTPAQIPERAALIQSAVGHMQRHVVDMLGRLRPLRAVEFGLTQPVEDLVAFWRARRPDVAFHLESAIDDADLALGAREAIYRVVQEALSNALRHGAPTRIDVRLSAIADGVRARVTDNGAAAASAGQRPRFGLAGMRERIAALGGRLDVEAGAAGWCITAEAPAASAKAAATP
jgi:two-component system sensor histidine kinase UhpB